MKEYVNSNYQAYITEEKYNLQENKLVLYEIPNIQDIQF